MSIDFTKYQKDICEETPQPPPLKKICSTCTPNPDYIAPDWKKMIDSPYLNEKECEYMVTVTIKQDGRGFKSQNGSAFPPEGSKRDRLLAEYVHPGITLMLEYYGKLIADQIICASYSGPSISGQSPNELLEKYDNYETVFQALASDPLPTIGIYGDAPRNPRDKFCADLTIPVTYEIERENDIKREYFSMDKAIIDIMAKYPIVNNPYALELYAYVKDFDHMDGYLKVLIAIPAFIFDSVPQAPGPAALSKEAVQSVSEVELDVSKLFGQISRLSNALMIYSKYQSHFYQTQDGFLGFRDDEVSTEQFAFDESPPSKKWIDYYASAYAKKIWEFWNILYLVSGKNGFSISSAWKSLTKKQAQKIKIVFNATDSEHPYRFGEIKAKQKGCEYVIYNKSITKKFKDYFEDETLMNYIAKINEIDISLQAKESYPWLDFLVKYTFPLLTVHYGNLSTQAIKDSVGQCVADNALDFSIDLKDYMLDEVLSLREVFAFEYNSKSCSDFDDFDQEPEELLLNNDVEAIISEDKTADLKRQSARQSRIKEKDRLFNESETLKKIAEYEESQKRIKEQIKNRKIAARTLEKRLKSGETIKNYSEKQESLKDQLVRLDDTMAENKRQIKKLKGTGAKKNYDGSSQGMQRTDSSIAKKRAREKFTTERDNLRKKSKLEASKNRHPYILKARELAIAEMSGLQDSILTSMIDMSQFQESGFRGITLKEDPNLINDFVTQSGKLSLCSVKSLTIESIRCLFSGVTEEVALDKIVRTTLEAMDIDVFGFFIKNLPPGVQQEVRQKLESEFSNIPLPWEQSYDPGDIYNSNYFKWLNAPAERRSKRLDLTNKCEEVYYQALQSLPQKPMDTNSANYQEDLKNWTENQSDIKDLENKLKIKLDECVKSAKNKQDIERIDKNGEKITNRSGEVKTNRQYDPKEYDWDIPEEEEIPEIPQVDTSDLVEKSVDLKTKEDMTRAINGRWQQYIDETYDKNRVDNKSDAAAVRDIWYEYTSYEDVDWNPEFKDWQRWWQENSSEGTEDDVATTMRKLLISADAAAERLRKSNEAVREKIATLESEQQAAKEQREAAVKSREKTTELKELLSDLSEQDLANAYANMRSDTRVPIGGDKDNPGSPGSYGTALGNAQALIQGAYIETLMDVYNVDQILNILDRFPGSELIGQVLSQVRCSYQGMFDPPIGEFMSTLSLQTCGGFRAGISIPSFSDSKSKINLIPNFNASGDLIRRLTGAFISKLEDALVQVIVQLLVKLFQTLDEKICQSINAAGKALGAEFSPDPIGEAVADAFCPDELPENLQNTKNNLFKAAGLPGNISDESFECLYTSLAGVISKNEILELFTNGPGQMPYDVLTKVSEIVNAFCPEFSNYLGSPDKVGDVFANMSNILPPELRDLLRNQITPDEDEPIFSNICLTQEDFDNWNNERENLLTDQGIDKDTARSMINKANEKTKEDIKDLGKLLANSPEGMLGDAINKLLSPPECSTNNAGIVILEDDDLIAEKMGLMRGFFEMLEKDFYRDLISRPSAVLNNILRDTNRARLNGHELRVNMTFLYPNYANSEEDWEFRKDNDSKMITWMMDKDRAGGYFPETIGTWMKGQLEDNPISYRTRTTNEISLEQTEKAEILLSFQDNNNAEGGDPEYAFDLKYWVHHTSPPKATIGIVQKFYKRLSRREKKKLGLESKLSGETALRDSLEIQPSFIPSGYEDFDYNAYRNKYSYQMMVFKNFLEKKINGPIEPIQEVLPVYDELNSIVLNFATNAVLNTPDGDTPSGFKFGYDQEEAITFQDLLYVNPDANPNDDSTWEYTYENEDAVLGKSATENPRVHFLDPSIHGGNYKRPKIYVEPATYSGWLGMMRAFISEVSQCEDKDTGFLQVSEISKRAKDLENNIPFDERLSLPFDCRMEVPYDKIASPATHGLMEGVVISTLRIYATEFALRTIPIFSGVEFDSRNMDNTFYDYLMNQLEKELTQQQNWWNIVQGYTYYLLFLEQMVQVAQRQIKDGLMEMTPEIESAYSEINNAQRNYDPKDVWARWNGSQVIAFGKEFVNIVPGRDDWKEAEVQRRMSFGLSPFKKELAAKIWTLYKTQDSAKIIASALIKKEIQWVLEKLKINVRPRPHIQDIHKYLLGRNGIMFGSEIRSGETEVEQPTYETSIENLNYGNIRDVVTDVYTQNPLADLTFKVGGNNFSLDPKYDGIGDFLLDGADDLINEVVSSSDISVFNLDEAAANIGTTIKDWVSPKIKDSLTIGRSGIFYLEKYLRVTEKDGTEQVYGIKEFQEILKNRTDIDPELKISDYYGDAFIVENQIMGSIGIKFGVRLVYCAPDKFLYNIPDLREQERSYQFPATSLKIEFKKSFYDRLDKIQDKLSNIPIVGKNLNIKDFIDSLEIDMPSTARAIPLVIYEQNLIDKKMGELDLDDNDFGQNLKCYIDNLVLEKDFKVLFDFCFPIRTYISLMGIYSQNSFFESIGQSEEEVDEDAKGRANNNWRTKVFKNSKEGVRDLFNSTYRTDDDVDQERGKRSKNDYAKFLKNILPGAYINIDSSVRWWQSFRIIDTNPFDADGKDCKNDFQKLFD